MIEAAAVLYLISAPHVEVISFVAEHRRLSGLRPHNASALSDARFGEVVKAGAVLCARPIKPL